MNTSATPTTPPATVPAGLLAFLAARALTPRQHKTALAFYRLRAEYGYAPSLQELGDELGISKVCASEHVGYLIAKGVLGQTERYRHRGLFLRWEPGGQPAALPELLCEIAALRGGILKTVGAVRRYADRARTEPGWRNLPVRLEQLGDELADLLTRTEAARRRTA